MSFAALAITLTALAGTGDPPALTTPPPDGLVKAVKKCQVCHGTDLRGKRKKSPGLMTTPVKKIVKSLSTKGPRPMLPINRGLTAKDRRALLRYLLKLQRDHKQR